MISYHPTIIEHDSGPFESSSRRSCLSLTYSHEWKEVQKKTVPRPSAGANFVGPFMRMSWMCQPTNRPS